VTIVGFVAEARQQKQRNVRMNEIVAGKTAEKKKQRRQVNIPHLTAS
jgi:hypothetical protein